MNAEQVLNRGLLPLWGGMRDHLGAYYLILKEVFGPAPFSPDCVVHDVTCGSATLSGLAQYFGASCHVNDLSERSFVAASSVFSGRPIKDIDLKEAVRIAEAGDYGLPGGVTPAKDIAGEYLTEPACRVFDVLYHLPWKNPEGMRYLALRWVMLQKTYMHIVKLPTTDLIELPLKGEGWAKVADMAEDPLKFLLRIAEHVNSLIHALASSEGRTLSVTQDDCREVVKRYDFSGNTLTGINPPTDGNDHFVRSNRLVDALLYNREIRVPKDEATGADLWRTLMLETGEHVPSGHHIVSFGGDGALSWEECKDVWGHLGPIKKELQTSKPGDDPFGLVLIERR